MDNDISYIYVIRQNDKFYSFNTDTDLIESNEFINVLNPSFTLKTEEDAIKLRSIFYNIDKETNDKIFKQNDKWIIVRADWFGELLYYEITTDKNGKIISIIYDEKEIEIPDGIMENTNNTIFNNDGYKFSSKDKIKIKELLNKGYKDYKIEVKQMEFENLTNPLKFFEGYLEVTKEYDDIIGTSNYDFILVEDENKYDIIESKDSLITNDVFLEYVSEKYNIKNEDDAKKFELLLDEIITFNKDEKKNYKKDNVWCFVRDKFFDDEEAILVLVNDNGKILYIDNTRAVNDESLMKIKIKDPNFVIDYDFKLISPISNFIDLNATESLPIEVGFNANLVNATDLYLAEIVDGKMYGFASGGVESPYITNIEGSIFDNGKHLVQIMLIPSGEDDITKAIESIDLTIDVTGGITEDERKNLDKFSINLLDSIKNNDMKGFVSSVITKDQINTIISEISENTSKANSIKEDLKSKDVVDILSKSEEAFTNFQEILKETKLDISKIKFTDYMGKEQKVILDNFKVLSVGILYEIDELLGLINCDVFLTKNGIYLFKFDPSNQLIPKVFMGY